MKKAKNHRLLYHLIILQIKIYMLLLQKNLLVILTKNRMPEKIPLLSLGNIDTVPYRLRKL